MAPPSPAELFPALAHYPALFRFSYSLTRSRAAAQDLTQQTFLLWARHGHCLRDRTKAKTWLFTTLYREAIRHRQKQRREQTIESIPEPVDETTESARSSLDVAAVLQALQHLEPDYRTPLVLFYLEQRSYQQIARRTRLPIGTVMTRLHRGKLRLRNLLTTGSISVAVGSGRLKSQS